MPTQAMTNSGKSTAQPLLVTSREAARMLSVGVRTLWRLANRGEIPRVRVGDRGVRYDVADLKQWIERQKTQRSEP